MTPEQAYDRLVGQLTARPGVASGRMMASDGLRLGDKYFAMLHKGDLVVKLPAARVQELVGRGAGGQLTAGRRVMREWFTAPLDGPEDWRGLADEALAYARELAAG